MRNFILGIVFGSVVMGIGYAQVLPPDIALDLLLQQQRADWIERQTYQPSPPSLPTPRYGLDRPC